MLTGIQDKSGTIAAGGAAQTLMAANSGRRGFVIQNVSASDDLWINELGGDAEADQPCILLSPGSMYEPFPGVCPTGKISVFGATTGQPFSAREW